MQTFGLAEFKALTRIADPKLPFLTATKGEHVPGRREGERVLITAEYLPWSIWESDGRPAS